MELASKYDPREVESKWYSIGLTTNCSVRNRMVENLIQLSSHRQT